MTALLFAIAGAAVGAIEAALLWRAARAGHLVAAAAGWLAGFAVAAVAIYRRLP